MQYETLTDLLNNEAAAYDYFYALSPEMQTKLQQRGAIRDLHQLKQAAATAWHAPHAIVARPTIVRALKRSTSSPLGICISA